MQTAPFVNAPGNDNFNPRRPRHYMRAAYNAVLSLDSLPFSLRLEIQEKIRLACVESWERGFRTSNDTFREDLEDQFVEIG